MKKLSWEEIEKIIDELAEKIQASDFKPDYIIGVTAKDCSCVLRQRANDFIKN